VGVAAPLASIAVWLWHEHALLQAVYGLLISHIHDLILPRRRQMSIAELSSIAPVAFGWFYFGPYLIVRQCIWRCGSDPLASEAGQGGRRDANGIVPRVMAIGLLCLAGTLDRLTFVTMYPALPFTVALAAWAIDDLRRSSLRGAVAVLEQPTMVFLSLLALAQPTAMWIQGIHPQIESDGLLRRYASWMQTGEYVRKHVANDGRLFVFGHPIVYYGAQLTPLTPYLNLEYCFSQVPGLEDQIIKALDANPQVPVVYSSLPVASRDPFARPQGWEYFTRLDAHLRTHYAVAMTFPKNLYLMMRRPPGIKTSDALMPQGEGRTGSLDPGQ
jgi:hypothetical protein